ncbi:MAG: ACT domain-containing protein, partial [bacterium]|nr:ACT domain-containing protein [bacterium]
HRFTVDEHSFLCLYHLDNLATDTVSHAKEREQIWRQIQKKDVLRLAILFHDIGKGRNGDHSILGARLIETIAQRLRYEESDINQMVFLVLNHLLMSHTAQHRDLADPQVTADFVDTFESAEQINMMYLLTFVDMHSVSPEAMTEWKNNLLWQLYTTAREFLLGDSFDAEDPCRAMSPTEQTCQELCAEFEPELVQSHLAKLPRSYSLYQGLNTIRQHLEMVRIFDGETPLIRFYPHVDPACRDMVMVYKDKIGLFNTICTSVLLENFNIEEARLNTRADGIVANNIVIRDALGQTDIPESRQSLLKERLNRLLISDAPPPPVPKSIGRSKIGRISFENHAKIFNDSSARFTVIVVRCVDRRGLLQDLTSVLTEKNINIHFARIITEGNRVTDVFYVADPQGNKITDQDTLIQLQQNLLGMLSLNHNE